MSERDRTFKSDKPFNLEDWEPGKGGEGVPIFGAAKPLRDNIPILGKPSLTENELAELLKAETVHDGKPQMGLLDVLGRMVGEVNQLVHAQDDAQRFKALVDEAARKGPEHKERLLRMAGCRMVTAQLWYKFPDAPDVLCPNWYVWQQLDAAPKFPLLMAFCAWWMENIEGPLHEVVVGNAKVFSFDELRHAVASYDLS